MEKRQLHTEPTRPQRKARDAQDLRLADRALTSLVKTPTAVEPRTTPSTRRHKPTLSPICTLRCLKLSTSPSPLLSLFESEANRKRHARTKLFFSRRAISAPNFYSGETKRVTGKPSPPSSFIVAKPHPFKMLCSFYGISVNDLSRRNRRDRKKEAIFALALDSCETRPQSLVAPLLELPPLETKRSHARWSQTHSQSCLKF